MKRTPITPDFSLFPYSLHCFFEGARVWDSSSSPEARVYFIEKDGGYYLKTAAKGALSREAELARYFHGKKLAPEVLEYISAERDFMLTERVRGEDMTFQKYLNEPKKLCDLSASLLRALHESDFSDCPVKDHTARYISTAKSNRAKGLFDLSFATEFQTADEAYAYLTANANLLKDEVLLHGDYCLPNIMLDDWRFAGFIDVGNGGVGDRHIDIFWAVWSMWFNLKTDKFTERFFDGYGRDKMEKEVLKVIASAEVFG